jgi:hypothetical protein
MIALGVSLLNFVTIVLSVGSNHQNVFSEAQPRVAFRLPGWKSVLCGSIVRWLFPLGLVPPFNLQ